MVLIYSRQGCSPCLTLKMYLDRKGISYKEFDMDKVKTAFRIAPTVVIDGEIISGLNLRRLSELLA